MRMLNRIAIAAVVALLLAAALPPVQAACGGGATIRSNGGSAATQSWIWTEARSGWMPPAYYSAAYPPFASDYATPPVNPAEIQATFWSIYSGIPGPSGDDAGTYTVPPNTWLYYNPSYYGGFYAAGILAGWFQSGVDGCNTPGDDAAYNPTAPYCTCVLLGDQDAGIGYYAMAANVASPATSWWVNLWQPGAGSGGYHRSPIILKPVPTPTIVTSSRKGGGNLDLDITVTVPAGAGQYDASGGTCVDCGPIGFQVVEMIGPSGSIPVDRTASLWHVMDLPGGAAQPVTTMGGTVTVESICSGTSTVNDVYVATLLHFDSTFTAFYVSANSTRIECGPTLADPQPQRIRPETPRVIRERSRRSR